MSTRFFLVLYFFFFFGFSYFFFPLNLLISQLKVISYLSFTTYLTVDALFDNSIRNTFLIRRGDCLKILQTIQISGG